VTYAPLAGVRVLDMSRLIPGGLATRRLADLGADVVKVEEPGRGDYLRSIPPLLNGIGTMHEYFNRGKRSIALNIHDPADRAVFDQLAGAADVLVEVSRPGRYAELGIDFAAMRKANPALVVCSITGFGQDGPEAATPSHGMNIDALAGCVRLDRSAERVRLGRGQVSLGAELGGLNAALSIVAAVFRARATGVGAWLDASCWDAAIDAQRLWLGQLAATGEPLVDIADLGALYDVYETSDGKVILLAAIEHKFWSSFCTGVGRTDLLGRWSGETVSFARDDAALGEELAQIFLTATAAEWTKRLQQWDVPGVEVLDAGDVLAHPHFAERHLMVAGEPGTFPHFASPLVSMGEGRAGAELPPAPELGQHRDEVMAEWIGASHTQDLDEGARI
jgi:crotonobetainyl-CoA:carnitine CoA-transferase CaiB-like acyl-CoA transferase